MFLAMIARAAHEGMLTQQRRVLPGTTTYAGGNGAALAQ